MEKIEFTTYAVEYKANHITEVVTQNRQVESNCHAISFLNTGETMVRVLDIPIQPGDPLLAFLGEPSTVDETFYPVAFASEVGKRNELIIIRRFVKGA